MLRENAFVVGGALLFAAGAGFVVAMIMLGLGWWYFGGYLGGLSSAGFGGFFIYVGRAETRDRRSQLRDDEEALGTRGPVPPRTGP